MHSNTSKKSYNLNKNFNILLQKEDEKNQPNIKKTKQQKKLTRIALNIFETVFNAHAQL